MLGASAGFWYVRWVAGLTPWSEKVCLVQLTSKLFCFFVSYGLRRLYRLFLHGYIRRKLKDNIEFTEMSKAVSKDGIWVRIGVI